MSEKALRLKRNEVVLSLTLSVSLQFEDLPCTSSDATQPLVPGVVDLHSLPIHPAKGAGRNPPEGFCQQKHRGGHACEDAALVVDTSATPARHHGCRTQPGQKLKSTVQFPHKRFTSIKCRAALPLRRWQHFRVFPIATNPHTELET